MVTSEKKEIIYFNSFMLHVLAMALMLCDHLWATIFPYKEWMTCVGRIAFPIFAFMIVEGYFHTHDFRKYILRMLIFAIISEIPFNYVYANSLIYPFHQNVLWTFFIGLLLIRFLENVKKKNKFILYVLASAGALLVGVIVGTLTMVDYYGAGVITVLMFYFLRKRTWYNMVLQFIFIFFVFTEMIGGYYYQFDILGHGFEFQQEAFSILALIPIWLYNGKQGYHSKWFQYFCYAFYPGHLVVLYIIWQLLV